MIRKKPAQPLMRGVVRFSLVTNAKAFARRPCATGGTSLADWLVDEYLMLGLVPLQNWMLLAIAIVILSVVVSAWLVRQ
jgi:hypothetical protein